MASISSISNFLPSQLLHHVYRFYPQMTQMSADDYNPSL